MDATINFSRPNWKVLKSTQCEGAFGSGGGGSSSVLTHSFDAPETASSSARLPRAFFSRMILALAVHLKGFGLALRWASQISMAASRSATLLNTPRRIVWRVISANSRSTRLIQDDDVGVKCSLKRGCLASQACTSLVLWVL